MPQITDLKNVVRQRNQPLGVSCNNSPLYIGNYSSPGKQIKKGVLRKGIPKMQHASTEVGPHDLDQFSHFNVKPIFA